MCEIVSIFSLKNASIENCETKLNLLNQIQIPRVHLLPASKNLLILHSACLDNSGRKWKGRNSKGSPSVLAAIERLKSEGYPV